MINSRITRYFILLLVAIPLLKITLIPLKVSAHVMVLPAVASPGEMLVFSASSPNESNQDVTSIKIIIPDGLKEVTPTQKTGWVVEINKIGQGESERISDITWSGGRIVPGQREDFSFGAQLPNFQTTLSWKAYQSLADGTVIAWDQPFLGNHEPSGNLGPMSVTKVLLPAPETDSRPIQSSNMSVIFSLVAVVLSITAVMIKVKN